MNRFPLALKYIPPTNSMARLVSSKVRLDSSSYVSQPHRFGRLYNNSLMIRLPGFKQDFFWSTRMIQVARKQALLLNQGMYTEQANGAHTLLLTLAVAYGKYHQSRGTTIANTTGYSLDPADLDQFGRIRTEERRNTWMEVRHEGLNQCYLNKAKTLISEHPVSEEIKTHQMQFAWQDVADLFSSKLNAFLPKGLKETMVLTQSILGESPDRHSETIKWVDTNTEVRDQKIYPLVEALFRYTLALPSEGELTSEETLQETTRCVGLMYWLLTHAVPLERGNAGVIDMFTKTILHSMPMVVPRWQEGIAPDLEAFVTPAHEFIKRFGTFFETPLRHESLLEQKIHHLVDALVQTRQYLQNTIFHRVWIRQETSSDTPVTH